jgi:predicted Zn-dependent protease with MMP-like domain
LDLYYLNALDLNYFMNISREKFKKLVAEAVESVPEKFKNKLNNVAIFVEDYPTREQFGKVGRGRRDYMLFGLFEGYAQARKLNFGPVLPDKITIFRQPICKYASNEQEVKQQVISTVKHEIAHHFGLDEEGARRASKHQT